MTRKLSPWAGAIGEWVWLSHLFETVERELGVSSLAARKALLPDLKNLNIHAQMHRLHGTVRDQFAREGMIFWEGADEVPRVSEQGWTFLTRNGRLDHGILGWPVRVRWAHVVETLASLKNLQASGSRHPISKPTPRTLPGGLNYADADQKLVAEMGNLIAAQAARGPFDAALMVADRAVGHGILLSKAKRLAKRFSDLRAERDGAD